MCIRHAAPCQCVHWPEYQVDVGKASEGDVGGVAVGEWVCRKDENGAVKTAATSLASRRGIRTSSTFGRVSVARVAIERVIRPDGPITVAVRELDCDGDENFVGGVVDEGDEDMRFGSASIHATQGRTPNWVAARFIGSWQRL